MMKTMKTIYPILFFFIASMIFKVSNVSAGILIEPYAGYKVNLAADTSYTANNSLYTVKSKIDPSPEYGGRLGFSLWGLWAALDYSQAKFQLQDTYSQGGSQITRHKTDVEEKKMALAAGGDLTLIRFWGKYYWDVQWDYKNTYLTGLTPTGNYQEEASGKGYAVGFAYKMLPLVNFFMEYSQIKIDEIESSTANGVDIKTSFPQKTTREIDSIMVGISLPLDLF